MNILIAGLGGVTQTFRHWPERIVALALVRRGHTVWSIGIRDPDRPPLARRAEAIDEVLVLRVASRYWPNHELAQALKTGPRPDVIHLMHPRNVLAAQITTWAQRQRIPTVYTWLGPLHDAYLVADRERPFESPPTYERLIFTQKQLVRHLLYRPNPRDARDALRNYSLHWPLAAANALLPCSEFEAAVLQHAGMTQPQTVVPLWIDVPFIYTTPDHPPPIAETPRPWLLFVGQVTPRKGYDLAIEALAHVVREYPTASLLVVSGLNQAQRHQLMQLAQHRGVAAHVRLLGYVSETTLINLYRNSDLLLFPTRYEGFGLPLLEAMAAECPIITTDIPVVREIIRHGYNGLLVPYNNSKALARAALAVLRNPALCNHLKTNGRMTLNTQYDEQRLVAQIEQVYTSVIAAPIVRYTRRG